MFPRTHILPLVAIALLTSCGADQKPPAAEPAKPAAVAPPTDESRRFPLANRVDTQVVDHQLLGKPFMPGGTLAHYRHAKIEYSMFIARMPSAQDAAFLLLDWNKALSGAQIIPSFGGYFGQDAGRPVFVFAKGAWIAGVAGLPEKDADLAARTLAAHLD
jgi:hypothetical protein